MNSSQTTPTKPNKLLRRLAIGIGSLLGLLLLAIIIIPLIVNVDSYRPTIQKIANEHLNGKLSIGKLSLSLLGQIEIDIEGLKIEDSHQKTLLSVNDTYLQFSFLSLLKGEPRLIFKMNKPEILATRNKDGSLNLAELVKKSGSGEAALPVEDKTQEPIGVPGFALGLIASAGIDIEITEAKFVFEDLAADLNQSLDKFDLYIHDISMSRPMEIELDTSVATTVGTNIKAEGPISFRGTIVPFFTGTTFEDLGVELHIDFTKLQLAIGTAIRKSDKMPGRVNLNLKVNSKRLDLETYNIEFHNAKLAGRAAVTGLETADPQIDFEMKSEAIDLAPWSAFAPDLKQLELEGRADFSAMAKGPISKLTYSADATVQNLSLMAPGLLAKPLIQVTLELRTDHLKKLAINITAPKNSLDINLEVKQFKAPTIDLVITSPGLNLDELLPPPSPAKPDQKAISENEGEAGNDKAKEGQSAQPETDVDGMLQPLRDNEFIKSAKAKVNVKIASLKRQDIKLDDFVLLATLDNLAGKVKPLSMKIFGGTVGLEAGIDLKPAQPTYSVGVDVKTLSLENATRSVMKSLSNTVSGELFFNASGSGQSLNASKILPQLKLVGKFRVENAVFNTIDVGKMATEALGKSIADLSKKIPGLPKDGLSAPNGFKSLYKEIGGSFTLNKGIFLAEDFHTTSLPKKGIDLQGRTEVDLIQDKLSAEWSVIDTYNITKAQDVGVNQSGIKMDHILAEKGQPVRFPVKVGCKMSSPCYDYSSLPEHFGKIIFGHSKNVADKLFDDKKKQLNAEIDKKKAEVQARLDEERKKMEEKAKSEGEKKIKEEGKKLLKKFGL